MYTCPEGCFKDGKPWSSESLSGWKRHMTARHYGASAEQLRNAVGGEGEGVHLSGEGSFDEYTEGLPETADGFSRPANGRAIAAEDYVPEPVQLQPKPVSARKMRARMDKMKQRLATDFPKLLFRGAGMELQQEDSEAIQESIETVLEIFGIDFEIMPIAVTIRSRLLVLLYPVAIIASIFGMKKLQQLQEAKKDEEKQTIQ